MKTVALGTKLYVEDDSDEYIPVGNITQISVPGPNKPEIDVTDFDSTASEFLPGLPDNGTLEFSGFYNDEDAGQDLLFDDANNAAAAPRRFRIDFVKQGQRFSFEGYVASFRPVAGGPREAYTFTGSIRVSGAVERGAIT